MCKVFLVTGNGSYLQAFNSLIWCYLGLCVEVLSVQLLGRSACINEVKAIPLHVSLPSMCADILFFVYRGQFGYLFLFITENALVIYTYTYNVHIYHVYEYGTCLICTCLRGILEILIKINVIFFFFSFNC